MKRILTVTLVLCTSLALSGCGNPLHVKYDNNVYDCDVTFVQDGYQVQGMIYVSYDTDNKPKSAEIPETAYEACEALRRAQSGGE